MEEIEEIEENQEDEWPSSQRQRPEPFRSYAFTAAVALLVAAYANRSLTGAVFLLAFFVWGSLILGTTSAGKQAVGLWGSVAAYSSILCAARCGIQLAFAVGNPGWASGDLGQQILALLGLAKAPTALQIILDVVPPIVVLVVACAEVRSARRYARTQDAAQDASFSSERHDSNSDHSEEPSKLLEWAEGYSSAGVVVAVALLPACLTWPALAAVVYLLVFLARVWRWARGRPAARHSEFALGALQTYTGLHILCIYLWQIDAVRIGDLEVAARWAGIFHLSSHSGNAILVPQIAMLVALHVLYAALGFLEPPQGYDPEPHFSHRSWFVNGEAGESHEPLLGHTGHEEWVTSAEEAPPQTLLGLVLPVLAGSVVHAVETVCYFPAVSAVALCCYSMVEPSVFSAVALLISVWALVTPSGMGKLFLVRVSPGLAAAFLAWHLAAYIATAVSANLSVPDLLQSMGVYAFDSPPPVFLPLAAQAAMAVVLGGLSRSRLRHRGMQRQSSRQSSVAHATTSASRLQPLRDAIISSPRSSDSGQDSEAPEQSSFAMLGLSGAQLLWHAGFVAIPVALFFVGTAQYDLLHAPYLLLLLGHLAWSGLGLVPLPHMALLPFRQYLVVRAYASLHLAATYVLLVAHLPGLGHFLEPEAATTVLRLLGLWEPSVHKGILPILAILLLATVHAGLGKWLEQQQGVTAAAALQPVNLQSVGLEGHPLVVLWGARVCTSIGSLLVVVLGYGLILADCPVSLIGLGYIFLLACVLIWPPRRSKYEEVDRGGKPLDLHDSHLPSLLRNRPPQRRSGGERSTRLVVAPGSKRFRWLPLALLAAFCAADFLVQYAAPASSLQKAAHVTPAILRFLKDVVGLDVAGYEWATIVRLMRPMALLGALSLLRFGFALGTLETQVASAVVDSEERARQALREQHGILAFCRRLAVRHCSKLVALAAFAAAMQGQDALGCILVVGIVLSAPLLGGPKSWSKRRQGLLQTVLAAADLLAVAWMVSLYTFQVAWLRQKIGPEDGRLLMALKWAGVVTQDPTAPLEAVLRFKCLILVAITLKRRSLRWLRHMPEEVKAAGGHGQVCCLFWPLLSGQAGEMGYAPLGWLDWWQRSAFANSLNLLVQDVANSVQRSTRRVLEAVDWSSQGEQKQGGTSTWGAFMAHLRNSNLRRRSFHQLHTAWIAFQDWTERFWKDWGFEVTMGTLLIAAFVAINVLSLVFMLFIGLGMALPPSRRRPLWRLLVLPVLSLLLVWQYAVLIGWPPFIKAMPALWGHHHHHHHGKRHHAPSESLHDWLGLGEVNLHALWALFFAFASTIIQVHYDNWEQTPGSLHSHTLGHNSSSHGLSGSPDTDNSHSQAERGEIQSHNGPAGSGEGVGSQAHPSQQSVWKPLKHAAKKEWSWVDWMRFLFYRHYMDVVLVAVVALCTVENDVIHAAYLAIALLLFRQRDTLRSKGNRLFCWLPSYNFAVMLLTLAYQAPWPAIFGSKHRSGFNEGCNLAHVLGLYKMTGLPGGAFSLTARGSVADVALWAIARLQTRVFASTTYVAAMRIVAEEQAIEAVAVSRKAESDRQAQAQAALEHSRLRQERAMRVARLKAGISHSGGSYGVNNALLELQLEAEDKVGSEDQQLQSAIPGVRPVRAAQHARTDSARRRKGSNSLHAPEQSGDADGLGGGELGPGRSPFDWLKRLSSKLRRPDEESYICYALFVALFITDFSLLALLLQAVLFCYALLAQPPARVYWQLALLYCEGILIAQYVYQVPTRLHCSFVTQPRRQGAEVLGLHGNALRGIPIFCVYLATLMHTYRISRQQEPALVSRTSMDLQRGQGDLAVAGQSPTASRRASGIFTPPGTPRRGTHAGDGNAQVSPGALWRAWQTVTGGLTGTWYFLRRTCSTAERPLHFIKVAMHVHEGQKLTQEGVQSSLQRILDYYRQVDIRAGQRKKKKPRSDTRIDVRALQQPGASSGRGHGPEEAASNEEDNGARAGCDAGDPSFREEDEVDLSSVGPLTLHVDRILEGSEAQPGHSVLVEVVAHPTPPQSGRTASWGICGWPIRSLKPAKNAAQALQRFRRHQLQQAAGNSQRPDEQRGGTKPESADHGEEKESGRPSGQPASQASKEMQRAATTPSRLAQEEEQSSVDPEAADDSAREGQGDTANPAGEDGASEMKRGESLQAELSKVDARSGLRPDFSMARSQPSGRLVSAFARSKQQNGGDPQQSASTNIELARFSDDGEDRSRPERRRGKPLQRSAGKAAQPVPTPDVGGLEILDVECHSRAEQDWYAATVSVDVLVFLWVVFFYQAVVASARTLQDISDDRVVPGDFLAVLLLLFFFMVLDRLFYTLGSHLGKAVLLVCQMVLFYWYCLSLFWSVTTGSTAKTHLRIILLLKSLTFAFSALQLRSGYPSPASYRGGQGRHAFVFMRQVNVVGFIGYSIFAAVPFLYELRALLDWSCTATTLSLFDWLKLEDIHTSLFMVTVSRKMRESRSLGDRQPRYAKFFQGTLLFLGLLILLWVPLIAFSSGNPTYQVPNVVSFRMNATLSMNRAAGGDSLDTLSFPIFSAGHRRSRRNWVNATEALPQGVRETYTAEQTKLLCTAQDSDELWTAAPPARRAIRHMLGSHNATLSLGWHVVRDAPLENAHAGPECTGGQDIPLAPDTRRQLMQVVEGKRRFAQLASMRFLNGTDVASPRGSAALYPYIWQLRGSDCTIKLGIGAPFPIVAVACNASLADSKTGEQWWNIKCGLVNSAGQTFNSSSHPEWANCSASHSGPRIVAVLERVQGGLIGQTLSSFGIIGLYITVVLAIGRFLRFSSRNMRMRIQYEDLPTTKRLVTMCRDIYIARAEGELVLEEELYWGLINIYRSSAIMFELTKKKMD